MKQSTYTGSNWTSRFTRQSSWDRGHYCQPKQAQRISPYSWLLAALFVAYWFALFFIGARYF